MGPVVLMWCKPYWWKIRYENWYYYQSSPKLKPWCSFQLSLAIKKMWSCLLSVALYGSISWQLVFRVTSSTRISWRMWFSFSFISCIRTLHISSKRHVFPYTIRSHRLFQTEGHFISRYEEYPKIQQGNSTRQDWTNLAAASSSPATFQQNDVQHTMHVVKEREQERGPQKRFCSLVRIMRDTHKTSFEVVTISLEVSFNTFICSSYLDPYLPSSGMLKGCG